MRAEGHVHIFTQTDEVVGDVATYDLDQAVLVVTGHNLKLTTPTQVLTARQTMVDILASQAVARVTLLLAVGGSFDPHSKGALADAGRAQVSNPTLTRTTP